MEHDSDTISNFSIPLGEPISRQNKCLVIASVMIAIVIITAIVVPTTIILTKMKNNTTTTTNITTREIPVNKIETTFQTLLTTEEIITTPTEEFDCHQYIFPLNNSNEVSLYSVFIYDFDQNNRPDIININYFSQTIDIFFSFETFFRLQQISISHIKSPVSISMSDINKDSTNDIIILDARNKITVFSHDKNNTLSKLTDFIIDDSQLVFIKTADMNHDQYDDIIVGYTHDLKLTIYFNDQNGNFLNSTTVDSITSIVKLIEIADINGDEYVDIIVLYQDVKEIDILLNDGTGQVTHDQTISSAGTPESLAINDMDMDQNLDLIVAYSNPNEVIIYFNRNNRFIENSILLIDQKPDSLAVGDITGDQKPDISILCFDSQNIKTFFHASNWNATRHMTFPFGYQINFIGLVNVRSMNFFDIFVTDYTDLDFNILSTECT